MFLVFRMLTVSPTGKESWALGGLGCVRVCLRLKEYWLMPWQERARPVRLVDLDIE